MYGMVYDGRPSYGTYDRVGYDDFAMMTKTVHELCYIVCHFYQNVMHTSCTLATSTLDDDILNCYLCLYL
jgi:hypothetical protein